MNESEAMSVSPDPSPDPLPGGPVPGQPPYPEELPPIDPMGIPQPGSDVIDPFMPTPGLPGGVPGGPPAIPDLSNTSETGFSGAYTGLARATRDYWKATKGLQAKGSHTLCTQVPHEA